MSFTIQCGVSKDAKSKMYKKRTINLEVRNLLDDNSLPWEKNWVEKSKTQKSLAVLRNIENFDHNSAENDDFDDGRI